MKKWLKENIFVKDMFLYILAAGIIFFIPSWVAFTIGVVIESNILIAFSAAYILLWVGPFTPTIPFIFAIAVGLKQIVKKITNQKE
jgi:CHASE2 domain-containing sensor protein